MKNLGHHACLREKEHLFRYRAYFEENLLRFVRARAHVRALIARISCAVGMRKAKLRNHLSVIVIVRENRAVDRGRPFTFIFSHGIKAIRRD